jgi:hypothetical protein
VTPEPNANLVSSGYEMPGNPQALPFRIAIHRQAPQRSDILISQPSQPGGENSNPVHS